MRVKVHPYRKMVPLLFVRSGYGPGILSLPILMHALFISFNLPEMAKYVHLSWMTQIWCMLSTSHMGGCDGWQWFPWELLTSLCPCGHHLKSCIIAVLFHCREAGGHTRHKILRQRSNKSAQSLAIVVNKLSKIPRTFLQDSFGCHRCQGHIIQIIFGATKIFSISLTSNFNLLTWSSRWNSFSELLFWLIKLL